MYYYYSFKRTININKLVERVFCMLILVFLLILANPLFGQPDVENNGFNEFFYANGVKSSEGILEDGKPNGYWKTYYETGNIKSEGGRKDFLLDSIWTFYRENGSLETKINYVHNDKNGLEQVFSKTSNLIEEFVNVDNVKQGIASYFYESSELYRRIEFIDDKEFGKGIEYAKDGRVITFLNYDNGFIRSIEKVNRLNKLGQKKGYWVEYWANGNVKEEGIWSNGVRNGVFKFFRKKSDLDRIEVYKGGKLVEDADEVFMMDIRKEYYENGKLKLVGSYKNGSKQGVFREYDQQGNIVNSHIYQGNVKSGEGIVDPAGDKQGNWKLLYPTGELRAQGQYINGLKSGEWKYFYASSKIEQIGNYKEGNPHGDWKWYYETGAVLRQERFRKGKEDGLMVEYSEDGNELVKGEFIDGLRTGPWLYTVNDHTEEGEYLDGEKNGNWIYMYDNKQTNFKGEYLNGIPVGKHSWYLRNGSLKKEGKYDSGERHGNWVFFNQSGLESYKIKYKYGEEIKIDGAKIPESYDTEEVN
ncbi:MAG: antitoxin component YwqK of YwqJK toxin-antitoxin module [Flavobacteriales bacterium]|jgi:antitoxin component YwqK of YwqJK toxin-antitoxin module